MSNEEQIHSVAVLGHTGSGKSSFLNIFFSQLAEKEDLVSIFHTSGGQSVGTKENKIKKVKNFKIIDCQGIQLENMESDYGCERIKALYNLCHPDHFLIVLNPFNPKIISEYLENTKRALNEVFTFYSYSIIIPFMDLIPICTNLSLEENFSYFFNFIEVVAQKDKYQGNYKFFLTGRNDSKSIIWPEVKERMKKKFQKYLSEKLERGIEGLNIINSCDLNRGPYNEVNLDSWYSNFRSFLVNRLDHQQLFIINCRKGEQEYDEIKKRKEVMESIFNIYSEAEINVLITPTQRIPWCSLM